MSSIDPSSKVNTTSNDFSSLDHLLLSSTATCISLSYLDFSFHPIFTHQLFDQEVICGYKPTSKALKEAEDFNRRQLLRQTDFLDSDSIRYHSSFRNHDVASKCLSINIILAPSCQSSLVIYNIKENTNLNKRKEHPELEQEANIHLESNKRQTLEKDKAEYYHSEHSSIDFDSKNDVFPTATQPCMSIDEIHEQIQIAIPPCNKFRISNASEEDDPVSVSDFLFSPIGEVIAEFSVSKSKFVITLANGSSSAAQEYHDQVQSLALWFIETADNVDISDSNGGFWKVLYVFEQHGSKHDAFKYSLVGYTTLFYFHAPFKKPKGGSVVRICQSLVLPPYQRCGHGTQMMKQIYEIARSDPQIVEINVEDPAPGFVCLRDRSDLGLFKEFGKDLLPTKYNDDLFIPLVEKDSIPIASELKITSRQVQRSYELMKLESYLCCASIRDDDLDKKYRIMVKKRLLKSCKEELGAFNGDKEQQKKKLGELFEDLYKHYTTLLRVTEKSNSNEITEK